MQVQILGLTKVSSAEGPFFINLFTIMTITYDTDVDILTIHLADLPVTTTEELQPGVLADYNQTSLVRVEVLSARSRHRQVLAGLLSVVTLTLAGLVGAKFTEITEVDNMPVYPRIPLPECLNDPAYRKGLSELLERIQQDRP